MNRVETDEKRTLVRSNRKFLFRLQSYDYMVGYFYRRDEIMSGCTVQKRPSELEMERSFRDNGYDFRRARVKQAIKYRWPSIRSFSLPLFFTVVIRQ